MGTHTYLSVLNESYPMNTEMTGFRWFSKVFASLNYESSLGIRRVGLGLTYLPFCSFYGFGNWHVI